MKMLLAKNNDSEAFGMMRFEISGTTTGWSKIQAEKYQKMKI